MWRRLYVPVLAAMLAASITAGMALGSGWHGGHEKGQQGYAIGLWGDLPYSDVQAAGVPNLIADMNSQDLAFTAHDGDLKSGSSVCTDAVYTRALAYLNSLRAPAAFTPGDNDWTDCDRTPATLARAPRPRAGAALQHALHPRPAPPPPGRPDDAPLPRRQRPRGVRREPPLDARRRHLRDDQHPGLVQQPLRHRAGPGRVRARNQADIAWMQQTFDVAKARHSAAVMLIAQADPGFDLTDATRAPCAIRRRWPRPTASPTASSRS